MFVFSLLHWPANSYKTLAFEHIQFHDNTQKKVTTSSKLNEKWYVACTVVTLQAGNQEVSLSHNNIWYVVELKVNKVRFFLKCRTCNVPLHRWMMTKGRTVSKNAMWSRLARSGRSETRPLPTTRIQTLKKRHCCKLCSNLSEINPKQFSDCKTSLHFK